MECCKLMAYCHPNSYTYSDGKVTITREDLKNLSLLNFSSIHSSIMICDGEIFCGASFLISTIFLCNLKLMSMDKDLISKKIISELVFVFRKKEKYSEKQNLQNTLDIIARIINWNENDFSDFCFDTKCPLSNRSKFHVHKHPNGAYYAPYVSSNLFIFQPVVHWAKSKKKSDDSSLLINVNKAVDVINKVFTLATNISTLVKMLKP